MTTDTKQSTYDPVLIKEKYAKLEKNGIWTGIITCLRLYGSLSTHEIEKLIDVKKTTVFSNINKLIDQNYVVDDVERSFQEHQEKGARARKYYKISDLTAQIFTHLVSEYAEREFDDEIEMIANLTDEERYARIAERMQALKDRDVLMMGQVIFNIQSYLQKIVFNKILELADIGAKTSDQETLIAALKASGLSEFASINMDLVSFPVKTKSQFQRLMKLFMQQSKEMLKLKADFEAENESGDSDLDEFTQYYFSFTSPLPKNIFED